MTSTHVRALVAVAASARLTRLLLTDELGIRAVDQVRAVAGPRLGPERAWLLDGLECAACGGYWLALGVLATERATRGRPIAGTLWDVVAGALAVNEVVIHAGGRLGDFDGPD